jgi:hypothetical protein
MMDSEQGSQKVTQKVTQTRKPNMWLLHVQSVREKYPDMVYKDVLQKARETYEKPKGDSPKLSPKGRDGNRTKYCSEKEQGVDQGQGKAVAH